MKPSPTPKPSPTHQAPTPQARTETGVDRRSCLKTLGASVAATPLAAASSGAEADGSPPVVDTHLHCFDGPDSRSFPYHPRGPYQPSAAATPEHLLNCMNGAGVDHAIVVHPEPYQDDHRYLDHCLEVGDGRFKGTCLFFSDRPESLARMPDYLKAREGQVVASRLHAYAPDRLPPFGQRELRQWWREVAEAGVAAQLHFEPRYAPELERYLKEFSETTVIIDHLGRPMQGTPEEHARVIRWADLPNTIMKFSSIPSRGSYPHRDVGPILRQLTDAWGAERIIYGGGFNAEATPESYRRYREELDKHLTHLSASQREAIFGGNAARLFHWR